MDAFAALPLCYFPPVSWLAAARHWGKVEVEVCQPYRKQRYTSRAHIRVANKVMTLTIPVERRNRHAPIGEKQIVYQEDWQGNHWRSLQFAYTSSPYFEFYADRLKALFRQREESLTAWNLAATRFLLDAMVLEVELKETRALCPPEAYAFDGRLDFDPGRKKFPDWFRPEAYPQVFEGFEKDLSGLDLLFNLGPESRLYLDRVIDQRKF